MGAKNRVLMLIVVALAFSFMAAVGCGPQGSTTTSFIGGTTGLKINFMENTPPTYIYDGGTNPFYIQVQLYNQGEWQVNKEDVFVRILGLDPSEYGVSPGDLQKHPYDDLMPSRKETSTGEIISGDFVYVEFPEMNYKGTTASNLPPINVVAKVCYLYGTNALAQVCVKRNPIELDTGVCKVDEIKNVQSSGGPVQVINFRQNQVGKNKVAFSFMVQHQGTGKVYEKSTSCGLESPLLRQNRVWVEVSAQDWSSIRCSGLQGGNSGTITLPQLSSKDSVKGTTITCTYDIDIQTDYLKVINVKLMYDYEQDVSTQMEVRHVMI